MTPRSSYPTTAALLTYTCSLLYSVCSAALIQPNPSGLEERTDNPLNIDWGPAPSPEDGPAFSANALRNTAFLPAQIGGIVGAYAISLVLVAITLLALTKKRRQHLAAGNDEIDYQATTELKQNFYVETAFGETANNFSIPNFSYPSPTKTEFSAAPPFIHHSPTSSIGVPGVDPFVDQRIVAADRIMAQQQLEEMYKYVMEHEEAKQQGIVLEAPAVPSSRSDGRASISDKSVRSTLSKKERVKPASLNVAAANEEKSQSRTSSLLSALKSPKKKSVKGVNISSPIMTPKSSTFPRYGSQEMNPMPPRHYMPAPPPPVPSPRMPPLSTQFRNPGTGAPLTPDISPESVQSIDERLNNLGASTHMSQAPTEADPISAVSNNSQVPLVGLPASPRTTTRFSTLPSSPKPGATFQRQNAPSAVRTGGTLPLRAYEPPMVSPSLVTHTTKQTVFERKGPLSPMSARTPGTAVPYSPYQPFTPCMPMTPSLVTKEDRKRMRKMVPKTPTLEMVRNTDDIW
jgi:hypothetical protein